MTSRIPVRISQQMKGYADILMPTIIVTGTQNLFFLIDGLSGAKSLLFDERVLVDTPREETGFLAVQAQLKMRVLRFHCYSTPVRTGGLLC